MWKVLGRQFRNLYQEVGNDFPTKQDNTFEERIAEFRKRSKVAKDKAKLLEREYMAKSKGKMAS
jgi:hypothetical protein